LTLISGAIARIDGGIEGQGNLTHGGKVEVTNLLSGEPLLSSLVSSIVSLINHTAIGGDVKLDDIVCGVGGHKQRGGWITPDGGEEREVKLRTHTVGLILKGGHPIGGSDIVLDDVDGS